MNDLSRPHSAARLSEDIGDVLSAIRRLIAEDEALDYARDRLQRQQPADDAGEALAERFGGDAALARQMVRDSAARREHPASTGPTPVFSDHRLTAQRARLVADPDMVPAHGLHPALVARREPPLRRGGDATAEPRPLLPLRLGDSDRVDSAILADQELDDWSDAIGPQTIAHLFAAMPPLPSAEAISVRSPDDGEGADFAEAFDAKARMRPEPPAQDLGDPALSVMDVRLPAPAPAAIDDEGDLSGNGAASGDAGEPADFWAAYLQSQGPLDPHQGDDQAAVDDPDIAEAVPATAEISRVTAAMTIPAYPDEPQPCDVEVTLEPEQIAEAACDGALAQIGAESESAPAQTPPQGASGAGEQEADPEDADAAVIHAVIREIIQEELHGELGQRFSRNLRAVIRREVAVAIDEHLERI